MKRFITILTSVLFMTLSVTAQMHIDLGHEGCNNFGGHGTQGPMTVMTQNWASANGLWYTVTDDNSTYGNLPPALYTMGVFIQGSGSDVINGQAELDFFNNARTCKLFGHANAGDAERSFVGACGTIDTEYVTQGSGVALSNGSKHSNIQNEVMSITVAGTGHPIFNGLVGTSWTLNDEWYWAMNQPGTNPGDDHERYLDSKVVPLAVIDEDGPNSDPNYKVPVAWEMVNDSGDVNISLTFGHTNGIVTPGDVRYQMWLNSLDYLNTACGGGSSLPINLEPIDEPDLLDVIHNYIYYYDGDRKIRLRGFETQFTDVYRNYIWMDVMGNVIEQGQINWDGSAESTVSAPDNVAYGVYIFKVLGTGYFKKVILR